jgi:hypothetical protein
MFKLFYDVSVVNKDGEQVWHRRFALKDRALNAMGEKLTGLRRGKIKPTLVFVPKRHQNDEWNQLPHDPWEAGPKPISKVYIHHSVTAQISRTASKAKERDQVELLDAIAHGRGFNGISYCWTVMPSGNAWEGRGFGIIEAGTQGHNTDGDSIVLVGNYSTFKPSEGQRMAIIDLIKMGQRNGFFVKGDLKVDVIPHRDAGGDPTSCPGDKTTDAWVHSIQKAVNN